MAGATPVIVTRPAREAAQWVAALRGHGLAGQALPLIDIRTLQAPELVGALARARERLAQYCAVMFVSPNAVGHFFRDFKPNPLSVSVDQAQAAINTRAWAPGPGTVQSLLEAGVAADRIDAPADDSEQFDSEALWQCAEPQVRPGDRVLIVRGSGAPAVQGGQGRQWLASQLSRAGAAVDLVAAYERAAPQLSQEDLALARSAAHGNALWLFSSSEAVAHLQQLLPHQGWHQARALATHPRIAQAARAAGFGAVHECRPALPDVAASIKSLYAH